MKKATVITAVPLAENLKKKVQRAVETRFDTTEIVYEVDPQVIGGMVVQIGAKRIDLSIDSYLKQIIQSL